MAPEQMSEPGVWDYIFRGTEMPAASTISKELLQVCCLLIAIAIDVL